MLARKASPDRWGRKATKVIRAIQERRARLSRVVAPQSSTASCETDEVMISAYCSGTFNAYPLIPLENGARRGNNPRSSTLRVTIVCAKR
jgi:hypothetical protein